jgi:HK97 family phage portal protein
MVRLWPRRHGAEIERRAATRQRILTATDGRDILINDPDGWEVEQPWLWWLGPAGPTDTTTPPIWGNPPPGADGSSAYVSATLPAVTRCTSIVCSTIAGLPWRVVRGEYDRLDTPDWITDPQSTRIDGRVSSGALDWVRMTAVEFWCDWIRAALWFGDGYVYVPARDSRGQPAPPLFQLHPNLVRLEDDDDGLYRYYIDDYEIPEESILHLRGEPPYSRGHGQGVMTRHATDLGLAIAVRGYTGGQYGSGVPAGYLKSTAPHIDQTKADDLKAQWLKSHGGSARSIAVLNATTEFVPIAVSPLDAQLDGARTWALRDIAIAFGVPPYMLGVPGDPGTYANVESRMLELARFTHLPWVRRIEATLDAEFPRGTALKIDMSGIERADTKTRYDGYASALGAGWLTIDEVRALEDRPPLGEPAVPTVPTVPTVPPPDLVPANTGVTP